MKSKRFVQNLRAPTRHCIRSVAVCAANLAANVNCFILHEQHFFVRIQERITQEVVPPPPPKPLRAGASTGMEISSAGTSLSPIGKLYASIGNAATNYKSCRVEDTVRGTIENKVKRTVQSVADAAIRRKVQNELRAERELARRKKAQEWEAVNSNKEALLAQLTAFEKMANDLDRGRSLRRLMDEITACPTALAELPGSLKLMALMANWLNPLAKAPWPEVDDVEERNPNVALW